MSLELVLSWVALAVATGAFVNLLRRKRLPLWDVFSFAVLGAVLCGLAAWAVGWSGWSAPFALLGAAVGSLITPQYVGPVAGPKRSSWYIA